MDAVEESTATPENDLLWRQLTTLPAFRALLRSVEARFYRSLDLPDPILDVGCGDGHFAGMAFTKRLDVGIDPWQGPLEKAAKTIVYRHAIRGFGDTMPFRDGYFSTAISNSVLEHIPNIDPVLYEINRVLRKDGFLVITVPNDQFTEQLGGAQLFERLRLNAVADTYRTIFNAISRHAHTDSPEVWSERLANNGFLIDRWQNYFSKGALHALEIGHVQGLPSAILHFLTGHWIIAPWKSNLRYIDRWLRPYFEEDPPGTGTMTFIVARKVSSSPVKPVLPPASKLRIDPSNTPVRYAAPQDTSSVVGTRTTEENRFDLDAFAQIGQSQGSSDFGVDSSSKTFHSTRAWSELFSGNWLLFVVALTLTLLAKIISANATSGLVTVISLGLWLAAIAGSYTMLWEGRTFYFISRLKSLCTRKEALAIVSLILLSLLLRTYDLTSHPFILSGSEASIGLNAAAVLKGTLRDPFAAAWLSNPSMPAFIMAGPQLLFGQTTLAVRLLSPLIGSVTVGVTYFVGRLYWGKRVGFLAAVLLTGSHVHIHYSRIGLTNIWDPLITILAIGFLYRSLKRGGRTNWLATGTFLGLGAYFFTTAHLFPFILIPVTTYLLIVKSQVKLKKSNLLAGLAIGLIISLPQLIFYITNPNTYLDRLRTLGIFQSGWAADEMARTGQSTLSILVEQMLRGLFSFNAGVDLSPSYNSGVPVLYLIPSALMIIGLGLAVMRVKKIKYGLLLIPLLVTAIISGFFLVDTPSSHRLLIAIPIVYLMIASALIWLGNRLARLVSMNQVAITYVVLIFAILISVYDIAFYFGRYRAEWSFGDRNTEIAHEISDYLNSLDGRWEVYFMGSPSMYSSFPTFEYLVQGWENRIQMIDVAQDDDLPVNGEGINRLYLILPERASELEKLRERGLLGQSRIFSGTKANPLFTSYEDPAND